MSNVQVIQDKAYFEVKVCKAGDIRVGCSKCARDRLDQGLGQDPESWGAKFTTGEAFGHRVTSGDIIGCLIDQSDYPPLLCYTLNGNPLDSAKVSGLKTPILAAVSVGEGAEIEVTFDSQLLEHYPPTGFSPIIFSQTIRF
jgi:hypothetical protein